MKLIISGDGLPAVGEILDPRRFFAALTPFAASDRLLLLEGRDHPTDPASFYHRLGGVRIRDRHEEKFWGDWWAYLVRAEPAVLSSLADSFPPARSDDRVSHIHLFSRTGDFICSFHDAFWPNERVLFGSAIDRRLIEAFASAAGGSVRDAEDSIADPEKVTQKILSLAELV